MTISELIEKLQQLQKEYSNLHLSPKNILNLKPYRRNDKNFVVFHEKLSEEQQDIINGYYRSLR